MSSDFDDDEISLISMCELAPSPISPYSSDTEDAGGPSALSDGFFMPGAFPPPTFTKPRRSRNLAFWLTRTQKYSSYAFLSFLGIHGTTVALTPLFFGLDAGNSSLLLARTYFYQTTPSIELALIPGSLAVHVGSGVALRILHHFQQKRKYGGREPRSIAMWRWRNFSVVSRVGWVLVPMVAAHAALTRLTPLWVDGDSSQVGLEYLGYGFWRGWKAMALGAVFYGGFVGAAMWHSIEGMAVWWKVGRRRDGVVRAAKWTVGGVWIAGLVRIVVGSRGVGGYLGRHYEGLYKTFFVRI